MSALARSWIVAARARRWAARRRGAAGLDRVALVRRHAPGRSFLDIGCMWRVDGAIAFAAADAGATRVTGVDVMPATERFEAERARRGSEVRFVRGDIHDPALIEDVGIHDVVFCYGVIYHSPHPLLVIERLRALCGGVLMLGSETLPELPGLRGACVLYPALDGAARRAYGQGGDAERVGLDTPFDAGRGFENWWWGISPSALEGMLRACGFQVVERHGDAFSRLLVARVM